MNTKTIKNFLLGLGIAALPAAVVAAPDPNFHIYLMLGQSNMEGTAPIQSQDRSSHPRVQVLQSQNCGNGLNYGTWREATPTLIRCPRNDGGLGPGDTFGDTLAENAPENVTIGLVGAAYGGAKIEYFLPNCGGDCTPPYGGIAGAPNSGNSGGYLWIMDLAQKAQEVGVIKGFIFHQGESNSGQQDWPQKVNTLVTSLRNDLGLSAADSPFIAGELPYTGCCMGHNSLVNRLPNVIENAHVVSAGPENGQTLGDKGDALHWDSRSVRIMGQRYANEMMKHISYGPVDCGTHEGNPVCCNISADPDGDGWGTQNDNEMCIVTPDTAGYIPPNPEDVVAAINVGASQGHSYKNIYYKADSDFSGGEPNTTGDSVSGADGSSLMSSERYGEFTYDIPLPNGNYSVELHFVELYWTEAGARAFSVSIEDQQVIANMDLYQQVGHDTVYTPSAFNATVNDASLTINVETVTDNGTLSGILVRTASAASSSSSSAQSSSSESSSSSSPNSSAPASSSSSSSSGGTGAGHLGALLLIALTPLFLRRRFSNF